MKNEMVFNEIMWSCMVRTSTEKVGAISIACSPIMIQNIYDNLIKTFFEIFF